MKSFSFKQRLIFSITGILFFCILFEIILRVYGVKPFIEQPYSIHSSPSFCLIPHPTLGFSLRPGKFDVTINEKVSYTCTHGEDSLRITKPHGFINESAFKKRIDLHGCSFTYGMGVSDSLTYPFLLQKALPNYDVRCFAVPGYGNIQTLLQLKEQIKTGHQPDILVLNYASFHDDRNALSFKYRMALKLGFLKADRAVQPLFEQSTIPYFSLSKGIQQEKWEDLYTNFPARQYSAVMNTIQSGYEFLTYIPSKIQTATHETLRAIHRLCKSNEIELLVVILTNDARSEYIQAFCEQRGIRYLYIGLPLPSEAWSQLPYDIHPNPSAHQVFTKRVLEILH